MAALAWDLVPAAAAVWASLSGLCSHLDQPCKPSLTPSFLPVMAEPVEPVEPPVMVGMEVMVAQPSFQVQGYFSHLAVL